MIEHVLDTFWPRKCEICREPCDRPGRYICSDCHNRLPLINTKGCCRICGRSIELFEGEFTCTDCKGRSKPAFDRAGSSMRFEDIARDIIHSYKFSGKIWLRDDFTDLLEATARSRFNTEEIDFIVPMPASFIHRLGRGYNQCAGLAKALAKRLGKPYAPFIAARRLFVKRQSGLDEDARKENAKNSFFVLRPSMTTGSTILVVDDIMTTGSTFSECARALKAHGAKKVYCVSLARSIRN